MEFSICSLFSTNRTHYYRNQIADSSQRYNKNLHLVTTIIKIIELDFVNIFVEASKPFRITDTHTIYYRHIHSIYVSHLTFPRPPLLSLFISFIYEW